MKQAHNNLMTDPLCHLHIVFLVLPVQSGVLNHNALRKVPEVEPAVSHPGGEEGDFQTSANFAL